MEIFSSYSDYDALIKLLNKWMGLVWNQIPGVKMIIVL